MDARETSKLIAGMRNVALLLGIAVLAGVMLLIPQGFSFVLVLWVFVSLILIFLGVPGLLEFGWQFAKRVNHASSVSLPMVMITSLAVSVVFVAAIRGRTVTEFK